MRLERGTAGPDDLTNERTTKKRKQGRKTMSGKRFGFTRRKFLATSAATGAALASSAVFAPAVHAAKSLKLGFVSPQTGPLAAFAEADNYNLGLVREALKSCRKDGSTRD